MEQLRGRCVKHWKLYVMKVLAAHVNVMEMLLDEALSLVQE